MTFSYQSTQTMHPSNSDRQHIRHVVRKTILSTLPVVQYSTVWRSNFIWQLHANYCGHSPGT